jgi:hypothetical protein
MAPQSAALFSPNGPNNTLGKPSPVGISETVGRRAVGVPLDLNQRESDDMRLILACVLVLCSTVAFAQSAPPPMVGGKPLVQVKPKGSKADPKADTKTDGKGAKALPAGKSIATRLQSCQDIDDQTKERLSCYDEVLKPAPKPKPGAAKTVMDCKFIKEEDERLTCYNGFVDSMPKMPKSS